MKIIHQRGSRVHLTNTRVNLSKEIIKILRAVVLMDAFRIAQSEAVLKQMSDFQQTKNDFSLRV